MLDYKINNNHWYLRWENWKDFLENSSSFGNKKDNKYVILTLHFNNASNIINIITTINNEKSKSNYDLLIVENSTNKEESKKLLSYIEKNSDLNITIIKPYNNIWSAWWYALWLEYIFSLKKHEYIFIIEDDVIILNENTFSEMIKQATPKNLVYINHHVSWIHSWPVQLWLYPINFLKKTWVTNPSYFTRSEDIELLERLNRISKKYNYTFSIVDKNYSHPYSKRYNWQVWWVYFVLRNALITASKWFSLGMLSFFINIFLYIWYSMAKYFIENNTWIFIWVFKSIFDFILSKTSYSDNINSLNNLRKITLEFPKNTQFLELDEEDLHEKFNNYFLIYKLYLSANDRKIIGHSKKIKDFFTHWVMIWWFFSPLYPLFMLSKNIVSIDEYDFGRKKYLISIIENEKIHYLKIFVSMIISIILFLIILPFLLLKWLYIYLIKFI